jgi:hypothetical protein
MLSLGDNKLNCEATSLGISLQQLLLTSLAHKAAFEENHWRQIEQLAAGEAA